MPKTNIACAQIDCAIGRPEINREKIIGQTRAAAERGANLVIFPECAFTGYAFESLQEAIPFAETIAGPSSEALASPAFILMYGTAQTKPCPHVHYLARGPRWRRHTQQYRELLHGFRL